MKGTGYPLIFRSFRARIKTIYFVLCVPYVTASLKE